MLSEEESRHGEYFVRSTIYHIARMFPLKPLICIHDLRPLLAQLNCDRKLRAHLTAQAADADLPDEQINFPCAAATWAQKFNKASLNVLAFFAVGQVRVRAIVTAEKGKLREGEAFKNQAGMFSGQR
jgi:hypothetical protein